jgi:hypothetical protein
MFLYIYYYYHKNTRIPHQRDRKRIKTIYIYIYTHRIFVCIHYIRSKRAFTFPRFFETHSVWGENIGSFPWIRVSCRKIPPAWAVASEESS